MNETAGAWDKLTPEDFERLVFSLLNREGYMNCAWHERPGEEEGEADIVCYRFTIDGPPELFQKYVVLCKHDKDSLSKYRLTKDLQQVREYDPYCVIIAANTPVTDYKKKVIAELENDRENHFKILLWEQEELQKMVEQHQDLRWYYLGVEIDDLAKLPGIRDIFSRCRISELSDELDGLLTQAYQTCIRMGRKATNSMLMATFLERENTLVNCMVGGNQKLREDMGTFISEEISLQREIDFPENGVRLTDSFVKTLILANRLAKELQRPNLDEKVFLYALLKISDSKNIRHIIDRFSAETYQSMEGALFCNNFDIDEQDHLKRFFVACTQNSDLMLSDVDRSLGEDLEIENFEFCLDIGFEKGGFDREDWFVLDTEDEPDAGDEPTSRKKRLGDDRGEGEIETYHGPIFVEAETGAVRNRGLRRGVAAYDYYYDMRLDNWFSRMMSVLLSHYKKLTDLFIFPEKPVQIKSEGNLYEVELDSFPTAFSHFQTEAIACMLLNKAIVRRLLAESVQKRSVSFAYQMKGHQSFRVTIMAHAVGVSIAFRKIYPPLWSGENLFLSDPLVSSLLDFDEGIVLVAGKPSSGKSTLMNAMVNEVNQKARATIVTLEDPVETFHAPAGSSVMQLQKGIHFDDYEEAALFSIKSGADLIVVDELKDARTCLACIDTARSGVLSVATINARSCREAFDRVLYMCNADEDRKMKAYLGRAVKRIVCLTLDADETESYRASLEVIDLAEEIKKAEGDPDSRHSDRYGGPEDDAFRLGQRIDAAFACKTRRGVADN